MTARPSTREAVKFNIERMKTMPDSKRKAELAPVSGVEVIATDKVKFNLSEPFVPLLANLSDRAGMMVSPKAAKEKGARFRRRPGLRRPLSVRRAQVARPDPRQEIRGLLGCRPDRL